MLDCLLLYFFQKKFNVIGFDINDRRIKELKKSIDTTGEFLTEELNNSSVQFTSDEKFIKKGIPHNCCCSDTCR